MRRWAAALPRRVFLGVMLLGSALITSASLVYFDFDALPPFALERLPVRFEALWLTSLRAHVASALLSFPLCLLLTTRALQRRPRLHRWLGRLTGICVLCVLVPSGAVLAFDAKGGLSVTLGFLLSGAIVACAMLRGIVVARRRELLSHAHMMRHVVAQMSVAVTSRTLLVALDFAGMQPVPAYVLALWGPVLVSAAVAELVSRRSGSFLPHRIHTVQRILRELTPLSFLVRARAVARPDTRLGR